MTIPPTNYRIMFLSALLMAGSVGKMEQAIVSIHRSTPWEADPEVATAAEHIFNFHPARKISAAPSVDPSPPPRDPLISAGIEFRTPMVR